MLSPLSIRCSSIPANMDTLTFSLQAMPAWLHHWCFFISLMPPAAHNVSCRQPSGSTVIPVVRNALKSNFELIINGLSGNAAQKCCPFRVICNGRCQTSDSTLIGHVPDAEQ